MCQNRATRMLKTNLDTKRLTLGDLIASVYDACSTGQARGILTLAVHARLIDFPGEYRL